MCLSHIIHDQHVSITVAIIITVTYEITSPNKLLKRVSKQLTVTKNVSNFLHRHLVTVICFCEVPGLNCCHDAGYSNRGFSPSYLPE